jgi:hypothetical protein
VDEVSGCRSNKPTRRYEVVWEREPSLVAAVEEDWPRRTTGGDLGAIVESLNDVMSNLQEWSKSHFKSVPKELEKKRAMLEDLRSLTDISSVVAHTGLEKEMDELLYREEIMWMQRSRVAWLREGDHNTKYFHWRASWRWRKNRIRRLKREDGSWTSDPGEMENMTRDFFEKLYTQEDHIHPAPVIDTMRTCIYVEMNDKLCAPFIQKEISDALFYIGPLKAPRSDEFPARFLQRNWGLLKDKVVHNVQVFFSTGVMPEEVNETAIVSIPKRMI